MELWTDANIDSKMCNSPLQSFFWGVNECLLLVCLFSRHLTHTDCWLCLCFMYDDWLKMLLQQLNQVKSASSCVPCQCIFTPSWRTTRLTLVKERRWSSSVPPGRLSASCQLSTDDVFLISICVPLQTQTRPARRTQSALLQSLSRYTKGRVSSLWMFLWATRQIKAVKTCFLALTEGGVRVSGSPVLSHPRLQSSVRSGPLSPHHQVPSSGLQVQTRWTADFF